MTSLAIPFRIWEVPLPEYGVRELPLPPIGYQFVSAKIALSAAYWRNALAYNLDSSWPYQPFVWKRPSGALGKTLYVIPIGI